MHPHLDFDKTGVSLSALCLVHCLVGPIAVVLLPLSSEWVNETFFHAILGPILLSIAAIAFARGYRKHKQMRVVLFGGAGLMLLFLGIFLPPIDIYPHFSTQALLSIAGSIFLISAHVWNIRYCRCEVR